MRLLYLIRSKAAVVFSAYVILVGVMSALPAAAQGSGSILINLAPLDGIAVTPENVFSYTIQSNVPTPTEAVVKGTLRYRQSNLSFSYTFRTTLRQGMNRIEAGSISPQWTYSSSAFRELFMDYKMLPQGTYEYCVSVALVAANGEVQTGGEEKECLYQKADDVFLINLVDPENNAKLYEHYPVFSWIVNYPFASQLTYRIRVAEIKKGQNTVAAITRNNPVYTESNLPQTTTTYPVYGRPLEIFQPYAWTVDAYYKGILLGGAEPWKFTIVEDSLLQNIPTETYFVDIAKELDASSFYALGEIKLKYVLEDMKRDVLSLTLFNAHGEKVSINIKDLQAVYGDNRFVVDLKDNNALKHGRRYTLQVTRGGGKTFILPIIYVNPDFQ